MATPGVVSYDPQAIGFADAFSLLHDVALQVYKARVHKIEGGWQSQRRRLD